MMQNKRLIAITGIIGSGKSTVRKLIANQGEVCFSCDEINAEMLNDPAYLSKLYTLFPEIMTDNGIDKRLLASIIFTDSQKREQLNQLAHPEILFRLQNKIQTCKNNIVFVEVPLLFGTHFEILFQEIIVVTCNESTLKRRIQFRDCISEEMAQKKIESQSIPEKKDGKTIYYIENNEDEKSLNGKIEDLLKAIKK